MAEERNNFVHNVIMEQCKKINMSGIKEVKAFDEETVVLDTAEGILTVKGENLLINNFSATSGELLMGGRVFAFVYSGDNSNRGFIRKLLK